MRGFLMCNFIKILMQKKKKKKKKRRMKVLNISKKSVS